MNEETNISLKQKKVLSDKAFKAYPKLTSMFKRNRKANHKVSLTKNIDLIYGVTTNGGIIVDFGQGRMMDFWDFIQSLS